MIEHLALAWCCARWLGAARAGWAQRALAGRCTRLLGAARAGWALRALAGRFARWLGAARAGWAPLRASELGLRMVFGVKLLAVFVYGFVRFSKRAGSELAVSEHAVTERGGSENERE